MHPGSLYRMQRREPECTTATISQSRLRRRPDKVLKLGEFPPDVLVLARGVVDFELAATRNEKSPVHCWPGLVVYLALSYSRGTLRSDYHRRWRA